MQRDSSDVSPPSLVAVAVSRLPPPPGAVRQRRQCDAEGPLAGGVRDDARAAHEALGLAVQRRVADAVLVELDLVDPPGELDSVPATASVPGRLAADVSTGKFWRRLVPSSLSAGVVRASRRSGTEIDR